MSDWSVDQGDCLERMRLMPAASVDAVVCDPQYGLSREPDAAEVLRHWLAGDDYTHRGGGFMGKTWDSFVPGPVTWREALRVLKPGGHLVAFGATRTSDLLSIALRLAGWEIRDTLSWMYGQGFPKSHNLPGGLGTALKPGWEPIILARKPLTGTVAATVAQFGTGALNIEGCRIAGARGSGVWGTSNASVNPERKFNASPEGADYRSEQHDAGRWPANVVLDEDAAVLLDAQSGELTSGANPTRRGSDDNRLAYGAFDGQAECMAPRGLDRGGASRFYYVAKASRREREAGLEGRERQAKLWSSGTQNPGSFQAEGTDRTSTNHHPTVKPLALMRWLCRLVTPPGGLILDPFAGSFSTGCAALLEGFRFLGIEQEAEYVAIGEARLRHWERIARRYRRLLAYRAAHPPELKPSAPPDPSQLPLFGVPAT